MTKSATTTAAFLLALLPIAQEAVAASAMSPSDPPAEKEELINSLLDAARDGDLAKVKEFLKAGADPNGSIEGDDGRPPTALELAACEGHADVVHVLLQSGASIKQSGADALECAVIFGRSTIVKILLDAGAGPNKGTEEDTLLGELFANCSGNEPDPRPEIVRLLIAAGIDINMHAAVTGRTVLHTAAGDVVPHDVFQMLLKAGADVNARDSEKWTPLMHAAEAGNDAFARDLIDAGADINLANSHGQTALMIATMSEQTDVVNLLRLAGARNGGMPLAGLVVALKAGDLQAVEKALKGGADPNAKDTDGTPVLVRAIETGQDALVRALLKAGASVSTEGMYQGRRSPSLVIASAFGRVEVVRTLLDAGADPDHGNDEGYTPLMVAASGGHAGVIHVLVERKANIQAVSSDQRTALRIAAEQGQVDALRALLDGGASKNKAELQTALTRAVIYRHCDSAQLLLQSGGDPNDQGGSGVTLLMVAAESGQLDMVRVLLQAGADATRKNREGHTALSLARSKGHADVVRLLLEAGAKEL